MDEITNPTPTSPEPPPETPVLPEHVTVLRDGDRTIYLVGTAHVSQESVQEVEQVIDAVLPDTVCIELCEARYNALTDESRWEKLDIFKVIREGKTLFLLANLAMGAYQRRLGAKLGIKPGAELLAGAKKADEIGADLRLVDRDIHRTLKRTWGSLGLWQKTQILGAIMGSLLPGGDDDDILADDIEELKKRVHQSDMMEEFAKAFPGVHKPLIDERDRYMMSLIEEAPGKTIVAVVGAGHVPGMKGYFKKPIDREKLKTLPTRHPAWGLLKWIIPTLILVAFYFGYTSSDHPNESLQQMLVAWIAPNAIAAAILTALAGGTLLSIATATVASPITSLNPLLGAGMVVGLVEAWRRKPTVADAQRINEDVQSFRGIYRNAFTRVLLVAVAATMGSAIGAWIGSAWLAGLVL